MNPCLLVISSLDHVQTSFRRPFLSYVSKTRKANLFMIQGDVYCALCGTVTFYIPPWGQPSEAQDGPDASYDAFANSPRTLWWLREISLLTEDLGGVGIAQMSDARHLGDGLYTYDAGNMRVLHYAYNHEADFPLAFPVHDVCISLFEKMLEPQVFDLECVYNTFKRFYRPAPSRCLTLDYGGAERFMGSQWKVVRGEEHYVISPLRDQALKSWYNYLQCQPPERNSRVIQHSPSSRDDPFVKLPPELVFLIMESMPMTDFCQWRGASRRTALLQLKNDVWRKRIIREMPWMFDVPSIKISGSPMDWERAYKLFHRASFSRGEHRYPALFNRKRIWETCSPLVEAYHEENAIQNTEREAMPETMIDAVVDMEPKPTYRTCQVALFLHKFDDLDHVHPKIVIEWTRDLEFKAIKAGNCGFVCNDGMNLDLDHQVFFPENGWLAGVSIRIFHDQPDDDEEEDLFPERIVITGIHFLFSQRPVGGHADFGDPDGHATHLLAPRSGHFIVGLKVYDDDQGRVTGIELIQQPLTKIKRPTRRAMVDMVSARIWRVENTKEKYWIGDDDEWW